MHCGEDVFFAPNQADVKWIAWDVAACSSHHRERRQAGLMLVMVPERRQRKIREREVGDEHAESNHPPSPVASHPNRPFLRRALIRGMPVARQEIADLIKCPLPKACQISLYSAGRRARQSSCR